MQPNAQKREESKCAEQNRSLKAPVTHAFDNGMALKFGPLEEEHQGDENRDDLLQDMLHFPAAGQDGGQDDRADQGHQERV